MPTGSSLSKSAAALVLLAAAGTARGDIVYGPWTFDDLAFADDAEQLDTGAITLYCGALDLDDALTGFSPDRLIVNIGLTGGNDFALYFTDLPAENVPGPDIVFFDTRFSMDPYELAVRPMGGSWTGFIQRTADEFVDTGQVACSNVWGIEVDISAYGFPDGTIVDGLRFRALPHSGGFAEGDPTMAAVLARGCAGPDADVDGHPDACDNCPAVANRTQSDRDGDGFGDACDCFPDDPGDPLAAGSGDVHVVREPGGGVEVAWEGLAGADAHRLLRGFVRADQRFESALRSAECIADVPAGTLAAVDLATRPHALFWYLVAPACDGTEGSLGLASDGRRRYEGFDPGWTRPACAAPARDSDGDGVADVADACVDLADPLQLDDDGDGLGDACDPCPFAFDPVVRDVDGDMIPDACDCDRDMDGFANEGTDAGGARCAGMARDNCPSVANAGQADTDGDGCGDACDPAPTDRFTGCR